MSDFGELQHTPEFELPIHYPAYPEDLRALVDENYEGLTRAVIEKMLARNKYEQIAQLKIQDPKAITRNSKPSDGSDLIAEYCMAIMQWDIDQTDSAGKYRVTLHGPRGRGNFKRAKHIDLSDEDGIAKSTTMLDEGSLLDKQGEYIDQLHTQNLTMMEMVTGMMKSISSEHKDMMKVISDSQRKLGEIEAMRLTHDLEIRMHNDEQERVRIEREGKEARWAQLLEHVEKTGATKDLAKGVGKILERFADKMGPSPSNQIENEDSEEKPKEEPRNARKASEDDDEPEGKTRKKKRRKKRSKKKAKAKSQPDAKSADSAKSASDSEPGSEPEPEPEINEEEIADAVMEHIEKHGPLMMAVEALKLTIDEKQQWPLIKEVLTEEQANKFDEVFAASDAEECKQFIVELTDLPYPMKIVGLRKHLDEDQLPFIDIIVKEAMS